MTVIMKILQMISDGSDDGSLGRLILLIAACIAFGYVVFARLIGTPEGTIVVGMFGTILGFYFRNSGGPTGGSVVTP